VATYRDHVPECCADCQHLKDDCKITIHGDDRTLYNCAIDAEYFINCAGKSCPVKAANDE